MSVIDEFPQIFYEFAHSLRLAILIRPASYPYGDADRKRMFTGSFHIHGKLALYLQAANYGKLYEYKSKGDTGQKRKLTTKYKIILI